jgi:hypothetical protein
MNKNLNLSPGVLFYQLKLRNQDNESLEDIWSYDNTDYERGHNFIQWAFPSDEPSSVNPHAPLVDTKFRSVFLNSVNLRSRLRKSYHQFLKFIGVNDRLVIVDECAFNLRVKRRNHNLQRITRVIRSLNILGLPDHAHAFLTFLMKYQNHVNQTTLDYWSKAYHNESRYCALNKN